MAAGPWVIYNEAKKYLGGSTIDLSGDVFKMALYTSASNAATATLSTYASVSNQVTNGNGYVTAGKTMTVTWASGASASEMRFDATAVIWSASGGDIANVKYAVVYASGGNLLCYSQLSTSQFTVTSGNTLKVEPSANGLFELN